MTIEEIRARVHQLQLLKAKGLHELVGPARAAVNAMKDAGMNRSADPLAEALFQIDANDAELEAFIKTDPRGILEAVAADLRGRP